MKTRTVRFSFNTCKDAALLVPAEPASLFQVSKLVLKSYLDHMFSRPVLMSDEVLVSSIGKSNFFGGALGGWETRLNAKDFAALKGLLTDSDIAVAVVKYREPSISQAEAYRRASQNEALPESERQSLAEMAEMAVKLQGLAIA